MTPQMNTLIFLIKRKALAAAFAVFRIPIIVIAATSGGLVTHPTVACARAPFPVLE